METGDQITVDYIILLICFGTTLQLLRNFTQSLWASIGFHLTYLEISRFVILQREQRLFTFNESIDGTAELFVLFFMTVVASSLILGCIILFQRLKEHRPRE